MLCEFAYPKVLHYFEEISAIPRGSYHEEKIAAYLVAFAEERGLSYVRDEVGNVLIDLPAGKGFEDRPPILLQGHTDMVCEKNEGVAHDFLKDPLKLYVKDGWLRAEGTTLGADDGVAVASMLALLDGVAEEHPALQCLFTVSEEVGLDGAKAFDYSRIYARKMVNMDSADEASITVGCAGGLRSDITVTLPTEPNEAPCFRLRLFGLAGGHSGEDIHRGRANANKLMGRVLRALCAAEKELRVVSIHGGTKDNAIPREAVAVLAVGGEQATARVALEKISREIQSELGVDDRAFAVALEPCGQAEVALTATGAEKLIGLLDSVPNGVLAMSEQLEGLVEFSRNIGIVTVEGASARLVFSSRSALDEQIDASASELDAIAAAIGGSTRHYNRYPGWAYAERSPLRDDYVAAYRKLYGTEPRVEVIHAGLECGIIKQALPDMDMLSCGPVVLNLHSPDEALYLPSFERFFGVILELLKA